MAPNAVLKFVVLSSEPYRNLPVPEPIRAVSPVLPDTLPVYIAAFPLLAVSVGEPVTTTLPPVEVPAAVFLPALATIVLPLTLFDSVKSPVFVARSTAPVAAIPAVAPTVPTIKASLSTNDRESTPEAAKVFVSLLA